jgi:hypothetical protein
VKVGDGERIGARAMERCVNGPFDGRTLLTFKGLALEVSGYHVFRAQTSFVGAHTRRDQDPFRFRLVDTDMAKDSDHALHGENSRAGGKLFA